ncbi:sugar nucleotide-binding protein [Metabacillus sp. RGM 3146]|uniref:sugar nucleotide-binding protein n=1 Tax=Metabacillus sp. RGM 3146 TaxID=3401092 RepID=UPI003B99DC8A
MFKKRALLKQPYQTIGREVEMKVIIFGISGTIGQALAQTLTNNSYDVYGTYFQNQFAHIPPEKLSKLSIDQLESLQSLLSKIRPDAVIMCLRGDFLKQLKFHVQTSQYIKENGGRMIFCSTSNVFDGLTDQPHYEDDEPKADSDYGKFKIECEKTMTEILGDRLTIVRIPEILGHRTPRINALLESIEDGKTIQVYSNVHSTRNTDVMLSRQIEYLISHSHSGIFHLGTNNIMIHSEFIKTLVSRWGYTDVSYESLKAESFSGDIPEKYNNALLSRKRLPSYLQLNHEQLIDYLTQQD